MRVLFITAYILLCFRYPSVPAPPVLEIEREYAEQISALSMLSSNLMMQSFEDTATWDSAPNALSLAHTNLCRASVFFRWSDGRSRGRDIFSTVSPETLVRVSPVNATDHGSFASALMVKCRGNNDWLPFTSYERIVATNNHGYVFGFSLLIRGNINKRK